MSLSEALGEGLMTTFVGLVIVFSVLIILMLVMMLMKVVFYNPTQKKKSKVKAAAVDKPVNDDSASATVEASADDTQLIAVLTAAVAAYLDKPASKFNIKSHKRVASNATAWNKAGVRDIIDSRF